MSDLPKQNAEACHNCRRRRLKCDRTLPRCQKCTKRGQECMGYQRLLRWETGVASRGKMAGVVLGERTKNQAEGDDHQVSNLRRLNDPLVQDMSHTTKMYLRYCSLPLSPLLSIIQDANNIVVASDVCRDLVLYDTPSHNLFRELIPMTHTFPILLEIIVANSALRMSNVQQQPLYVDVMSPSQTNPDNLLVVQHATPHKDALVAQHKALFLLQLALTGNLSVQTDVTLAVVLLFIEFELLLDSGRDNWAAHINGARAIIEKLCGSDIWTQASMSPLRSCLISNCLIFDILGSTFARPKGLTPNDILPKDGLCLLQDAEGNHCSSFPTYLLQLLQAGAQLLREDQSSVQEENTVGFKQEKATTLLRTARSFDPVAWAMNLQSRSPASDTSHRMHVASGHCAAVCIYLSRVVISLDPLAQLSWDPEALVSEAIHHLSFIRPNDALFTATTWPAFIAGAETFNYANQVWITKRFQELWLVEPWGTIRGALGLLQNIWAERSCEAISEDGVQSDKAQESADWVRKLRGMDVDWLII